jgi:hypothetical protein
MFGTLGKLYKVWRMYRKLKPYFTAERIKAMGRKTWITIVVGVLGVAAKALGLPDDQWQQVSDWLINLLMVYFGANVIEHGAEAVKALAAKKNGATP